MKEGRIAADGTPVELMRENLIGEVFGVQCRIIQDPSTTARCISPCENSSPRFRVEG